jgi:hypothetical protein
MEPVNSNPVSTPPSGTIPPTPPTNSVYSLTNSTYIQQVLNLPGNDLQVQIGDIASPSFKPHINIAKWQNEVNLAVEFIETDLTSPSITLSGNQILYQKPSYTVGFTALNPDGTNLFESGGHEFDITFNSQPPSNVISFTVDSTNLDFFYQAPLTPDEIAQGSTQPVSVAGSYAVYHSSKSNNQMGGNQYFTGKLCHIYAPLITDNSGNTVYGQLNILNGIMTITIPQDFLDNATYPIVVDPTFGYTTIGGSNLSGINVAIIGSSYGGTSGSVMSVSLYQSGSTGNIQLGIYVDQATNAPLIGNSSSIAGTTSGSWISASVSGTISNINYNLCFYFNNSNSTFYYDAGSSYSTYTTSFGTWPSTVTWTNYHILSRKISIYTTYTTSVSIPTYSSGIPPQPNIGSNVRMF